MTRKFVRLKGRYRDDAEQQPEFELKPTAPEKPRDWPVDFGCQQHGSSPEELEWRNERFKRALVRGRAEEEEEKKAGSGTGKPPGKRGAIT